MNELHPGSKCKLTEKGLVFYDGVRKTRVGPRQARILKVFLDAIEGYVSKQQLADTTNLSPHSLTVYVSRLRTLFRDCRIPLMIDTRGQKNTKGYILRKRDQFDLE